MKTYKVLRSFDSLIEKEIKDLKSKMEKNPNSKMFNVWENDLFEISLLRKKIGQFEEKFLDRNLPF